MKKLIIILSFVLAAVASFSQTKPVVDIGQPNAINRYKGAAAADSLIFLPRSCGVPTFNMTAYMAAFRGAALCRDTCNNIWYSWSPNLNTWDTLFSGGNIIDSILIDSSRITYFVDSIRCDTTGALDEHSYLVCASPTGGFAGKANQIAKRIGGIWNYQIPVNQNYLVVSQPLTAFYQYNGSAWNLVRFVPSIGGDAIGASLQLGTLDSQSMELLSNSLVRFSIKGNGDIYAPYVVVDDTANNYLTLTTGNKLITKKFDTLRADDPVIITVDSGHVALRETFVDSIRNGDFGGTTERFGIEDNLGLQNRDVDMSNFSLTVHNSNDIVLQSGADANPSAGFESTIDGDNPPNHLSALYSYDASGNVTQLKLRNGSITFDNNSGTYPTITNGYLPISVNGNFADNTGNITVSSGGGGGIGAVYAGTGLTKVNDSTLALTTPVSIANGGTNNGSLSVTNGNLLYTDGSKVVALTVGTAGQHLVGGTIPHWVDTVAAGGGGTVTSIATTSPITGGTITTTGTIALDTTTASGGWHSKNYYDVLYGKVTTKQVQTATSNQTAFTWTGLPASTDNFEIYVDGVMVPSASISISTNTITLSSGVVAGAKVILVKR